MSNIIKKLSTPWKMKLFYLQRLPSIAYWGVKIEKLDTHSCSTSIPYSRRTKNPFKSIYFAAQMGAGELSTGILAIAVLNESKDVSMLVVNASANFYKKATQKIIFTCAEGDKFKEAIALTRKTGEAVTVKAKSVGKIGNEVVSEIEILWSFKKRSKR